MSGEEHMAQCGAMPDGAVGDGPDGARPNAGDIGCPAVGGGCQCGSLESGPGIGPGDAGASQLGGALRGTDAAAGGPAGCNGLAKSLSDGGGEPDAASELSGRLSLMKASDLSLFLSSRSVEGTKAFRFYMQSMFDFGGMGIEEALREFCNRYYLAGESQAVERALNQFAERYHETNPGAFSLETVAILANAAIMLNTDLHNASLNSVRKMTRREFVENVRAAVAETIDEQPLKAIYNSIRAKELSCPAQILDENLSTVSSSASGATSCMLSVIASVQLQHPMNAGVAERETRVTFEGYLVRKLVRDSFARRSSRRSWRRLYVLLRGSQLEFRPDRDSQSLLPRYIPFIPLRHALARPIEHPRGAVFEVEAYQGALIYFESGQQDVSDWVDAINVAAAQATVPCPAVPMASHSAGFEMPLLPMQPSEHARAQQLRLVSARVAGLTREIQLHIQLLPGAAETRMPRRAVASWDAKMAFLNREMRKYQQYERILRTMQ